MKNRLRSLSFLVLAALTLVATHDAGANIRHKTIPVRWHNPLWNPGLACCGQDTMLMTLGGTSNGSTEKDSSVVFAWPADAIVPPWFGVGATADTNNVLFTLTIEGDTINAVTVTGATSQATASFGAALDAIPSSITGSSATGATIITAVPSGFLVDSVAALVDYGANVPTGTHRNSATFNFRNYSNQNILRRLRGGLGPLPQDAWASASAFRVRLTGTSTQFVRRARLWLTYWVDEK